jgi:hypothetical protein
MPITFPNTWERRCIDDKIIWIHKLPIKCYACGKEETCIVSVFEGIFDPDLEAEIITEEGLIKVYPTFAPKGRMEWKVPEGWTQILHITSNFFPNETLTEITMGGMNAFEAFEKWYAEVMSQFGEWVCSSDECWMNAALKIRKEYNDIKELAKTIVNVTTNANGQ